MISLKIDTACNTLYSFSEKIYSIKFINPNWRSSGEKGQYSIIQLKVTAQLGFVNLINLF